MSNEVKKISDIVNSFVGGIDPITASKTSSFLRSWESIIGERISAHCKIIDVNNGMLILEVDHPGWSQEILFQKQRVLKTLSSKFPELEIKNLSIRVSSECKTPYVRQDVPVGMGIEKAKEPELDVEVGDTVPDELKGVLERLKESIKKGKQHS